MEDIQNKKISELKEYCRDNKKSNSVANLNDL